MKKINLLFTAVALLALLSGCKKDNIPCEKSILFEESFDSNTNWTIVGEIDSLTAIPHHFGFAGNSEKSPAFKRFKNKF